MPHMCIYTAVTLVRTYHINGLVQGRRNSIANALELRLSCINQMIFCTQRLSLLLKAVKRNILWLYKKTEPVGLLVLPGLDKGGVSRLIPSVRYFFFRI